MYDVAHEKNRKKQLDIYLKRTRKEIEELDKLRANEKKSERKKGEREKREAEQVCPFFWLETNVLFFFDEIFLKLHSFKSHL